MPDLRFGDAEPTDEERIAVDEVVADLGSVVVVEGERLVYAGHARTAERRHLLLPALHAVQRASGWISPGGLDYACRQLEVPPAEAYGADGPMDMMDKPDGLPTSPQGLARHFGQAKQRQQDVINRILAA